MVLVSLELDYFSTGSEEIVYPVIVWREGAVILVHLVIVWREGAVILVHLVIAWGEGGVTPRGGVGAVGRQIQ